MSTNLVVITGNLASDPITRQAGNTNVTNFEVAVNRRFTSGGNTVERVQYVKVAAWRGLAETCGTFLSKGRHVVITGRLEEPECWIGQDGKARAKTLVTASNVEFGQNGRRADDDEGVFEAAEAAEVPASVDF